MAEMSDTEQQKMKYTFLQEMMQDKHGNDDVYFDMNWLKFSAGARKSQNLLDNTGIR